MSYGLNVDNNPIRGELWLGYTKALNPKKVFASTSINQDLKLRVTIADYSKRCWLSQIIHRVIQVIRYVVMLGHTQWNATKKELSSVLRKNVEESLANDLKGLCIETSVYDSTWRNTPFCAKLKDELGPDTNSGKVSDHEEAIEQKCKELARSFTKQIDFSKYANQFMNDLLAINTAPKTVFASATLPEAFVEKLNFSAALIEPDFTLTRDKRPVMSVILKKEAKDVAKKFVAYINPDQTEQDKLLKDKRNFYYLPDIREGLFPQEI